MKNLLKSFVVIALMAMFMLLIVGCSSDVSNNEEKNDDSSEQSGESEDTNDDSGLSGKLEIQYFVGGYGDAWWKEVIGDFKEKHPNLEIVEHAGPNINEEMKTRWISNNPPDVVYIDGNGASETQMIKDGQLMDLSSWAKDITLDDGTPLLDSFISPPEEIDGGKIYSLPLVFDTWGAWYDSNWFEKEGFTVPENYDSWVESMKEIKEKTGIYPFITTGKYPQYFQRGVLYPAFAAAGGEKLLNNLLNGEVDAWKDERTLEVIKKAQKLQEEGLVDPGFAARSHTQTQMNFLLHKNAFIPVGFWLPKEMSKDTPEDFEYGFIPTPMNDSGDAMALVPDIRPIAIAKEAENPEAAKAFVEFVLSKKYAQKFAESTGAIMNLKGVDLSGNNNVPEFLKGINDLINNPGKVEVHNRKSPEDEELEISIKISDEMKAQIVPLLLGKIDADEFIDSMVDTAEKARK